MALTPLGLVDIGQKIFNIPIFLCLDAQQFLESKIGKFLLEKKTLLEGTYFQCMKGYCVRYVGNLFFGFVVGAQLISFM